MSANRISLRAAYLNAAASSAFLGCVALAGLAVAPAAALAQAAFTSYSTYDNAHRLLGTIGLSAQSAYPATRYTYDGYGRLSLVETGYIASWQGPPTLPSNWSGFTVVTAVATSYDAYGRKIQSETTSGGTPLAMSQTTYDAYGRVSCEAERMDMAALPAVGSSACSLGTTGPDGPDRITQHNYDSLSRVTSELRAVGTSVAQTYATYTYGGDSEQTSVADANGNLTTTIYDGFDRVSQTEYPTPSNGAVSNTADYDYYQYDAQSNMVSHRLRDGNVMAITYDALNRKVSESVPGANPIYITYDLLNRPTMYAFSQGGSMDAIAYDNAGRITSETTNNYPMTYAYDADGDRTQITYMDGKYIVYAFNAADQLSTVQAPQSTSSPVLLASYTYDGMGRRTGLARGSGTTTAYSYDGLSRLSTLAHAMPTTYVKWNQTYTLGYTASSQLNQVVASNSGYTFAPTAKTISATPNGLNQLTTSGSANLSYDARGNLTFDGVNTYTYDTLNQLSTFNGSTTLGYDARNRLISVSANGATPTQFVYVGDQLAVEFQVSGSTATILDRYVPGVGEDRPIAMYNSSTFTYQYELLEDHAGSIVAINSAQGDDIHVNRFDDYGIQGPLNWGRYQYTGQVWLSEVGLYNYKARMYSPSLGRFMQTDPVGYKDGPNWYAYVHDDPVNGTDPSGTAGLPCAQETYCDAGGIPRGAEPGSGKFLVASSGHNSQRLKLSSAKLDADAIKEGWFSPFDLLGGVEIGGFKLLGEAGEALLAKFGVDEAEGLIKAGCGCFVAGTQVETEDGLKPIEQIKVGDRVFSRDEVSGKTAYQVVSGLIRPHGRSIYNVRLERSTTHRVELFEVTDDHPWRSMDGRWLTTLQLTAGATLATKDGKGVRVISVKNAHKILDTYNLEVSRFHTFFVGHDEVWVHNANCFSAAETGGLKQLFGQGMNGARAAAARLEEGALGLPKGVTPSTLRAYKEAITAAGPKTANAPVNVIRLYIIDSLLGLK